jgi:putative hydrolase of the HAD superfamily
MGQKDMGMADFRAVLWDFGGVITSSPFEAFRAHEAARGLPADFIRTVNATHPDSNAWARLERGEIDAQAFDRAFRTEALALGHDVRGADVLPLLSGRIRPRMVAALDACKAAGLTIGCITNNAQVGHGTGMAASADQSAEVQAVLARFDHVIESSRAGVRKPDPAIYRMMCAALSLDPAQCIYLDDLGINCKPAAAMGMTAIKVAGEAQALAELSRLTGLPL